jgi:hypothetical protein
MKNTPVTADPIVIDYTRRNGRREGLLYNNRLHTFGRGDGRIELKNADQYEANRTWILENFKK